MCGPTTKKATARYTNTVQYYCPYRKVLNMNISMPCFDISAPVFLKFLSKFCYHGVIKEKDHHSISYKKLAGLKGNLDCDGLTNSGKLRKSRESAGRFWM